MAQTFRIQVPYLTSPIPIPYLLDLSTSMGAWLTAEVPFVVQLKMNICCNKSPPMASRSLCERRQGACVCVCVSVCVCVCVCVVWCGVVWCGVLCCAVLWCGVVWCVMVWCGMMWCVVVPTVYCGVV